MAPDPPNSIRLENRGIFQINFVRRFVFFCITIGWNDILVFSRFEWVRLILVSESVQINQNW
jgi:hypothetical protein